ncbi:MAG: CBS domain-containing protein [Fretibacterium sp.]|nr:CBS domain-containing protein [Fretibacterium sp.]
MTRAELENFIGADSLSIAEAMRRIDRNSGRVLILVDAEGRLAGTLTDGDIRRFLLAGGKLDENVYRAANKSPKFAYTMDEAKALFHQKNYSAIPVLDGAGRVAGLYIGEGGPSRHASLKVPVVINAGGKGTRLDPFTRILPKPLIPVGDLPIIEHIMRQFTKYDCDDFHVIVNYKRQLLKAYFYENENHYNISWYDEDEPLGTGGGLCLLKRKMTGTFFFSNCDNLLLSDFGDILAFHREHKNAVTMICAYKNFPIPYGIVEMGPNGRIESAIREKPQLSFLTNTAIYVVEPEVLEDIEDNVAIGFPDIVEQQRQKGRRVAAYPVSENEWMDMGELSELEKMRKRLYGE